MSTPADMIRRARDVVAASIGAVLLAPVIAAAAVAARWSMGPGVFYGQRRLGRGGTPFVLWKFRTMRHPAPGRAAPEFDDERRTRVGDLLRATSLDELPSLWNVLRGDLSLVGPRPLPVHYFDRFRGDEYERFTVRPGITGLAQVTGRNAVDWDERLALDVEYVRNRSFVGDLRLLGRTVGAVASASDVDQAPGVTMTELPADR